MCRWNGDLSRRARFNGKASTFLSFRASDESTLISGDMSALRCLGCLILFLATFVKPDFHLFLLFGISETTFTVNV